MTASREHIVCTPDICGGKPRIAGTRIQVKHLVVMHDRQKMSPDEIVSELPHLTLADVHAALAYDHDHREAIDAEVAADRAWYEEMKAKGPSRVQEKLRQWTAHTLADPVSLDENIPRAIAIGWRHLGIDVPPSMWTGLGRSFLRGDALDGLSEGLNELIDVLAVEAHAHRGPRLWADDEEAPREVLIIPDQRYGRRPESPEDQVVVAPISSARRFHRPATSASQELESPPQDTRIAELEHDIDLRSLDLDIPFLFPVQRFIDRDIPAVRGAEGNQAITIGRDIAIPGHR
jgi:uncharacterized protein (DUF433 family)